MKSICTDWIPQNEYTRPLEGTPYYRNSGNIYALDSGNQKYMVCRIDYERFDEQNFQYIFTPKWSVIDALPASVFQEIPGLDLSMRLAKYYRVNMTPVFISERTPGEGREDLWELLESVGLDYYDRFEWLLRTDMRCGTDNLIVERAANRGKTIHCYSAEEEQFFQIDIQPDDQVRIESLQKIAATSQKFRSAMLMILRTGAQIMLEAEKTVLTEEECSIMLKLLLLQEMMDKQNWQENRTAGIIQARENGKYKGRKRQKVDAELLGMIAEEFQKKRISESDAMQRLGINSRSTFYRRLKEVRRSNTI